MSRNNSYQAPDGFDQTRGNLVEGHNYGNQGVDTLNKALGEVECDFYIIFMLIFILYVFY